MPTPFTANADRDRNYQCELAQSLVSGLGYHGAIDECLRNGWEGVLAALLNLKTEKLS